MPILLNKLSSMNLESHVNDLSGRLELTEDIFSFRDLLLRRFYRSVTE